MKNKVFSKLLIRELSRIGKEVTSNLESGWVNVEFKDGKHICFSFNEVSGELESIGFYEDVVEVVDRVQIWRFINEDKG